MENPLYLTIHGHFYQPPRENPWTGFVERQDSASPNHDWNDRIADQCYSPNGVSRILSPHGRIERLVNNYSYMSFNIGPTLMNWIRTQRPIVYQRIREGDMLSMERLGGHGNAIAQVYNHIIMPLASECDKITQIRWGKKDFEFHFNREPEGMWLAETAINMDTVVALIKEGIKFTILSPKQAQAFRPLNGKSDIPANSAAPAQKDGWIDCSSSNLDTTRPYRIIPRDEKGNRICDGYLDVFFYNADLSSAVGFEHLLRNANDLGSRILSSRNPSKIGEQLISIGTDGESYGHHEPFGDMCAAFLFERFCPENNIAPVNYGWYLKKFPPQHEVQIKNAWGEGSAWSCAHGVGRWYRDCGCSTGGGADWNQKWREPLRKAFDCIKNTADKVFETEFPVISDEDCWKARDNYIDVLLEQENPYRKEEFAEYALRAHTTSEEDKNILFSLMEIQKFCLYSYTSCGWFFNDIEGLEPVQNMRYAMRAMELLKPFLPNGDTLESEILTILSKAVSNEHHKTGTEIWTEFVKPKIPMPYILLAAEAVKLHSKLSHQPSSNISVTSFKSKENQTIMQATYRNPDTYETTSAGVLVVMDVLGRVKIVVQAKGGNSRRNLIFAEKDSISMQELKMFYPNAFVMRMHELPQDILADINKMQSNEKLSPIIKMLLDFAEKYGVTADSLADQSNALAIPLRNGMLLYLSAKIRQLAIEALYNDSDSDTTFESIEAMKEEFDALKAPLKFTILDEMYFQRLEKLISRVQETQNQSVDNSHKLKKLVNKITELITIADLMGLDIKKATLENQSYDAYKLYCANTDKYSALKPMFEWLNFEV